MKLKNMQLKLSLTIEAKRKVWLSLPYRVRLRIEHFCYVAGVIVTHWQQMKVTALQRIWLPVYRKAARFYPVILKLNNPYKPFTNVPVSDKEAQVRINNFLSRFTNA